jgi:flagellar motility protein MotE (MotC chaperone)
MNPFKKMNVFTLLMATCVFAIVMRVADIAHFRTQVSVAESTTPEKGFKPVEDAAQQEPVKVAAAEKAAAPEAKPEEKESETSAAPPPMATPDGQGFSAAEVEILQSLSQRRAELDRREQQIGQREALLKAAGVEVDRKIAELNKIRGELEDLLNKQKTAEDERINSLVKIYENMKPKDAANIFNTLEMDVLLPVIGKISERKASPILAAMNPEKAREVTIELAEQRKLPQLPDDKKTPLPLPH